MAYASGTSPVYLVSLVSLVSLVHLVDLVYLVSLVQPNRRDRPDRPNRPHAHDRLEDFFSILLDDEEGEAEAEYAKSTGHLALLVFNR